MVPLLFEADATDFSTRGLYALTDAISCTVTEEDACSSVFKICEV